ncbi:MAG: hypothetical protein MZV65_54220 [Chromatiales bacterium]|nr:hypothetical protein [Chromatiales bacterium]
MTLKEVEAIVKDANFTIEQAKTAYREASKQLYERDLVTEDEAGKFRVSIGPIGNAVAEAVDAEAFLFVRYAGFKKSEGLIAKEVVANAMLGVLTGVSSLSRWRPAHPWRWPWSTPPPATCCGRTAGWAMPRC